MALVERYTAERYRADALSPPIQLDCTQAFNAADPVWGDEVLWTVLTGRDVFMSEADQEVAARAKVAATVVNDTVVVNSQRKPRAQSNKNNDTERKRRDERRKILESILESLRKELGLGEGSSQNFIMACALKTIQTRSRQDRSLDA